MSELKTAQFVQNLAREYHNAYMTIEQAHACWAEHSDDYCASWLTLDWLTLDLEQIEKVSQAINKFEERHGKLPDRDESKRQKWRRKYQRRTEKIRAKDLRWHQANKEKLRAKNLRWYQANKEKVRAKNLRWYHANKEKTNARSRAWKRNKKARENTAKFINAANILLKKANQNSHERPNED